MYERFRASDLPQTVDVPTGLGKTSVMALWLVAFAKGAILPRRLVYVVDRRSVVDQATRFAEQLRSNLRGDLAEALGIRRDVGGLPISTLRGRFADNGEWLEDPSKPAILVGTIDMVGSRLLFEGYGVSRRMRSFHAGLLGVDTLVLLDEAHLCPPFEALLRHIANDHAGEFRAKDAECVTPPFRLMSLSATGRERPDLPKRYIFTLHLNEKTEPTVQRRLRARKRLRITELTDRKTLARRIADMALQLGGGERPARVLVYCHSRRDAIEVKKRIDKAYRNQQKGMHESELLVGERRIYERRDVEKWLDQHGFLGSADATPTVPIFLVSTSAGEVGVDLNAEHMVCDLVSWERMVQRLGRVNRRGGEDRSATVEVVAVRPAAAKSGATKAAKEKAEGELALFAARLAPLYQLPAGHDDRSDASPDALVALKTRHPEIVGAATSRPGLYPQLTRPLLDAWSMTSLKQHEGRPEVAPWLRGWEKDQPQTTVVWRRHLPTVRSGGEITANAKMIAEFFRAAPIHLTERLEARSSGVLDWILKRSAELANRIEGQESSFGDADIVAVLLDRAGDFVNSATLDELRWLGAPAKKQSRRDKRRKKEWSDRLLPGATLVVDSRLGGLRDGMLDFRSATDAASADSDKEWRSAVADPAAQPPRPTIGFRVEQVTAADDGEGLVVQDLVDWRHIHTFETDLRADGRARYGLAVFRSASDPTNEDSRSFASETQSVSDHARQVEERARSLACRLRLSADEVEAIAKAARLHDDGKATDRWQDAMNAPRHGRPYAKTAGSGNWRLLDGYRHEFGSLLQAEAEDLPPTVRDLVLHLIAAHHGHARPLIRPDGCDDGPPSLLESKAGEAALRFQRLQKAYGPWGLAWREAILRASDQWASRESARSDRKAADG